MQSSSESSSAGEEEEVEEEERIEEERLKQQAILEKEKASGFEYNMWPNLRKGPRYAKLSTVIVLIKVPL